MMAWIVSSSVLILVIIALRYLLQGKISLRLGYALWALVLVRLLVPVSFGSTELSVMNAAGPVVDQGQALVAAVVGHVGGATLDGATPEGAIVEPDSYTGPAEPAASYAMNRPERPAEIDRARAETGIPGAGSRLLLAGWLVGGAMVGLCLFVSNFRFAARLRRSRRKFDTELCPLPVYVSSAVETPCLFGLLKPSVYITPEAMETETVLRHALEHETTHYRHGDHIWSRLRGLCLALHWYNPLVWWAASLARRDAELACDEGTIRRLGESERTAYGHTLIDLTCTRRNAAALFRTATTMTGGHRSLQERVALIAQQPRRLGSALAAAVLVAAVAAGCTFTGAGVGAESVPDQWFIEEAWPRAESYAASNRLSIEKSRSTVLRYASGASADVYFHEEVLSEAVQARSVGVYFHTDGDGNWAVIPVNAVNLIDPNRWYAGDDISVELSDSVPAAVIDYAQDYVARAAGALNAEWAQVAPGCSVAEGKITGLTQMNTGTASPTHSINMYRLQYRLRVEGNTEAILIGDVSVEEIDGENWTRESSKSQPYLLLYIDYVDGKDWQRIGATTTEIIDQIYAAPEMLARYENKYTAATMELYHQYLDRLGVDPQYGYYLERDFW